MKKDRHTETILAASLAVKRYPLALLLWIVEVEGDFDYHLTIAYPCLALHIFLKDLLDNNYICH